MTDAEAQKHAAFLKKWCKGKPIMRMPGSNFFSAGKWMTKITPEMIAGMEAAGYAELLGSRLVLHVGEGS